MKLIVFISNDHLELPLSVRNNVPEMARALGVTHQTIYSALDRFRKGKKSRFIEVEVDENE